MLDAIVTVLQAAQTGVPPPIDRGNRDLRIVLDGLAVPHGLIVAEHVTWAPFVGVTLNGGKKCMAQLE